METFYSKAGENNIEIVPPYAQTDQNIIRLYIILHTQYLHRIGTNDFTVEFFGYLNGQFRFSSSCSS